MDLFALLVEQNPDGVLAFDRDFRYTIWNPVMEQISGCRREDVVGRNAFELFPFLREIGEDRCFEAALRGEVAVSSNQHYRIQQTGRTGVFDGHYIPIRDASGAVVGGLAWVRNVTARQEAEARAKESREFFESYMAFIPGVAFVKDAEGRHVYANRLFEQTHGLPPGGAIGKFDTDIFPPDTAERFRNHDLEVLAKGQPVRSIDEQGARNEPEHWMWVKFPITDAGGRQLVAGVAFNITEQYEAEQALRASEERHRQLSGELEEVNRRKDEFLATLGHELRNPLAPLLTAAELLRMQPAPDAMTEQAIDVIRRQAEQMRRLIDDLLDVARITRGIVSLQLQRIDLREALQDVLHTVQSMLDAREHQLVVAVPAGPVYVRADRVRLEQIMTNLLSNAAKFTPARGRIEVSLERGGDAAIIRVADTGKGIPHGMLSKVFDLFTQVNPSIDRAEGGLGLGLTLVKRLTEMHGGTVEVTSAGEGKGSEFKVQIPIARQDTAEPTEPRPGARRPIRPQAPADCRVLIVDDNIDSAAMLNLLLPGWGYVTAVAHSGTEALQRAQQFKPHIILLDIGLPEMSGYEVAQRLREDPDQASTVIVALTGYGQEEDRRRTQEAGFAAHLTKPVDVESLNRMLIAVCDKGGF
jgi:PAS domain S-box-containing protein